MVLVGALCSVLWAGSAGAMLDFGGGGIDGLGGFGSGVWFGDGSAGEEGKFVTFYVTRLGMILIVP